MMERRTSAPPSFAEKSQGPPRERILALPHALSKTTRRRRWLAIGLVVVLTVGSWHASLRRSTGPARGGPLQGPPTRPATARETFRVGTLNIHGCVGPDRRYDERRVAGSLQGLDIVALNEVRGWSYARSANQAAALGGLLGMGWLYAPAAERWYCRQFGNGLLATRPTERWERIPLPATSGTGLHNALLARTCHENHAVQILVTHLVHGDRALRDQQLQAAIRLFLSLDEPVILLGDLNTTHSDPQIRNLLAVPGVVDALASKRPSDRRIGIDWILVRGLRVVDTGIRDEGASDHPLVWAEVAWPAADEVPTRDNPKSFGMAPATAKRLE